MDRQDHQTGEFSEVTAIRPYMSDRKRTRLTTIDPGCVSLVGVDTYLAWIHNWCGSHPAIHYPAIYYGVSAVDHMRKEVNYTGDMQQ